MAKAHAGAEAVRNSAGYSGGDDGSEHVPSSSGSGSGSKSGSSSGDKSSGSSSNNSGEAPVTSEYDNGNYLIYNDSSKIITVVDPSTKTQKLLREGVDYYIGPDGQAYYFGNSRGGGKSTADVGDAAAPVAVGMGFILPIIIPRVPLPETADPYDREDVPNPSPYAPEYDTDLWKGWTIEMTTNCYAYALNYRTEPNGEAFILKYGLVLGYLSGGAVPVEVWEALIRSMYLENGYEGETMEEAMIRIDNAINEFISIIIGDLDAAGYWLLPYDENDDTLTMGYSIAIMVTQYNPESKGPDYHFMRENGDGTWSHKLDLQR